MMRSTPRALLLVSSATLVLSVLGCTEEGGAENTGGTSTGITGSGTATSTTGSGTATATSTGTTGGTTSTGLGNGGSAAGLAACYAANARFTACGVSPTQTGWGNLYGIYGSRSLPPSAYGSTSSSGAGGASGVDGGAVDWDDECLVQVAADFTCVASCLAAATCAELASFPANGDLSVCANQAPPSALTTCASACDPGCYTPLVLAFEASPVRFEAFTSGAPTFDLGIGMSAATDWPSAATPWLAIDRNGNGAIDDGSELFGTASPLAGGGRAENGFAALRELDSDGDGRITPADEAWSRLLVWTDRNGDRVSSPGELSSLDEVGVVSIDLDYTNAPRCDARGNCEVERARFRYRLSAADEREGAVVDVHLRQRAE